MKDGAAALVDDIEDAFSGLTEWFSSLWDKITGIFDRAIGGIKSGIMSVTDALGITDSKREERKELAEHTPPDPEFERQKQAIIARRKKREQAQAVQAVQAADGREQPVVGGVQAVLAGAGRAQAVRMAPDSSSSFSSVRNSSQTSSVRNDNRRQEVNITINGNADRGTAQQIGNTVSDTFKSGAMSPVQ